MKTFSLILFSYFLTAFPVSAQQNHTLVDFHWLTGTWAIEKTANAYEEWKIANDSTLIGRGYKVNGKDTVVSETIEIALKGYAIWYIPSVSHQNQGKPVPFRLITHDPEQLTFENSAHDFPTRINYFKEGDHAMRVWTEGEVDGHIKKVSFDMKRIH